MAARTSGALRRTHPFAQALRRAIDTRGVTLTWLHETLAARGTAISMATLSSWRSGARRPEGPRSVVLVAAVELALGIPAGALSDLVGPSHRTGRIGDPRFPWDDQALEAAAMEAFEAFGADFPPPVRELTASAVTDVGPSGRISSRVTRTLLQSTADDVTSYPLLEVMPWVAIPQPTFTVLSGGRVSATFSHSSGRVHGALIGLNQPLGAGATTMLEVEVEFSPEGPALHETGHGVGRSIRELLLWIRFAPQAMPDWCNLVEEVSGQPLSATPLVLDRGGSGHASRSRFGPGALGVHWGYEGVESAVPFGGSER